MRQGNMNKGNEYQAKREIKKIKKKILSFAAVICLGIVLVLEGCKGSEKERQELRLQGIGQLETGNFEEAIASFEKALEISKGVVGEFELDILKYRAEAEYGTEDYEAAAYTYEVLLQIDKERPEYRIRLCTLWALSGKIDKAKEEYQKLYATEPQNPETAQILLTLGQALTDQDRFDEAIELYRQAVDGGIKSGEIYNRMGVCELEAGEIDSAIQYLEKGIETGDESAMEALLRNQAAAYERKQDFAAAQKTLERYVAVYGASPEIQKEIDFLKTR